MALPIPLCVVALVGCAQPLYSPERATVPYPANLHAAQSVDIHVFRDADRIEIVNATGETYRDIRLWINQRYAKHVDELPAGTTLRLSLWDFYDERGEAINAGGFWRIYEPDPVRLVQIQFNTTEPLVGLVAIPDRRLPEE